MNATRRAGRVWCAASLALFVVAVACAAPPVKTAAKPGAPAAAVPAATTVAGIDAQPGSVSDRIPCAVQSQFGYYLRLPSDFTTARQWPVIYVMDPGGGKSGTATRYLKGATFNGFIIAVSAESSNSNDDSGKANLAMVEDVNKRLPIDPLRQYASGFSGGSRSAGWLGDEMSSVPMAGVLCCGAGPGYGRLYKLSSKTALYGLCGSNCFNRWDMPVYFSQEPCRNQRLRYFIGNHDWADETLILHAMIWMNARYLADNIAARPALRAECEVLFTNVLAEIDRLGKTAPIPAWELAEVATFFPPALSWPPLVALRARFAALGKQPETIRELAALRAEEQLIKRHFATGFDFRQGNDPKASEAAKALAVKHAGTSRAPILAKLAEPCVK